MFWLVWFVVSSQLVRGEFQFTFKQVEIEPGASPTVEALACVTLPCVTLPYATYEANSYDPYNDVYVFKNIRFAAAPTGDLRWQAPQPPPFQSGVQNGSIGGTCCQPAKIREGPTESDQEPEFERAGSDTSQRKPPRFELPRPRVDLQFPVQEDCLFLDVYVPRTALNSSARLPVLFWIYGGGYVGGFKDEYNGTSLIRISNNSIIYVATNYRLGAFGFLAGGDFQYIGGVANAGLLDQEAALNWTQRYIGLFGGDPANITVMGESAGGGSIMHHITSRGGTTVPVFKRAIPQSAAFNPQYNQGQLARQFYDFANSALCGGITRPLACLRKQSTQVLQNANDIEIAKALYGQFQYGPAIDGIFVRDLPGRELLNGRFARSVQLMLGHNSDEGFLFVNDSIITDSEFNQWLSLSFPYANNGVISQIKDFFYPPPPNSRYLTNPGRINSLISDGVINCNVLYLSRAFLNATYNYEFAADPGYHGLDLCWSFYPIEIVYDNVQVCEWPAYRPQQFQRYLVSFVKYGNPNTAKDPLTPSFQLFGTPKYYIQLNWWEDFKLVAPDTELPEDRCKFWQPAPYIG